VVFQSRASDLTSTGDGNTAFDVYVRDRQLGRTLLASVLPGGGTGVFESVGPDISGNGRYVVFESGAADVLGSGPGLPASNQVYVKDRLSDTT
jgi:hypothetical protein